ncbi:MAG: hypothetical protein ABII99_02500, partial [Patescibacteria group bacterium]|nr:hypothetical protein [Patescibacteria group bacterium]MBU1421383.1 hypothetical protein [Patescibacteria group bacterium]
VQLSWDNIVWVQDPIARDTGIISVGTVTAGTCKSFFIKTCMPATGVTEGAKSIGFYFEAEAL